MATRVPGWLKFVGITGVIVLIVAIGTGAGVFFFLRSSIRQFEAADRSFDTLVERHGGVAVYRPEPDGVIPADRLEAFLAAREQVGPRRERTEDALALLSPADPERDAGVLSKLRGTVGLLNHLGPFHRERNEAMVQSEIGLGEYYYLYTLVYYSWLGKSPADGPAFKLVGEEGYLLETVEPMPEWEVRTYRTEQARTSLNRLLLPVLRNQIAAASARPDGGEWTDTLAAEIAAMEADPLRLPWQDGLPAVVERSLAPYRDRLDGSYSAACNAIEVGLARRAPDLRSG